MEKLLITLLISQTILVLPVVSTRFPPLETEVAILTQPEGNVRVRREQRTLTATDGMLLDVGDVVRIEGDGTAVIFQAYVPITRLRANQSFDVTRRSPPPPERSLTTEEFTSFKVQYIAAKRNRGNPSPVSMGGSEDAQLTLLEPRNSVVLTSRPTLHWSRVPDSTGYLINIYDHNEAVVCTQKVQVTQLSALGSCQSLQPGNYKWEVIAQLGERISPNPAFFDATSFTVVTEQRAAEINKVVAHAQEMAVSEREAAIVFASTLMDLKIYPLAETELRAKLELSPTDQTLWALLIETYAQTKRWRAREKAKEISAGTPTVELIRSLALRR